MEVTASGTIYPMRGKSSGFSSGGLVALHSNFLEPYLTPVSGFGYPRSHEDDNSAEIGCGCEGALRSIDEAGGTSSFGF